MFRIVPNPTFTCKVLLSQPGADKPEPVQITFRHKTREQLAEYQARAFDIALQAGQAGAGETYLDYVAECIDTWAGVVDADDKPLPYTRDNLRLLLSAYASAGPEIVRAYAHQLADARAGN